VADAIAQSAGILEDVSDLLKADDFSFRSETDPAACGT
jgi:hypothetical protein